MAIKFVYEQVNKQVEAYRFILGKIESGEYPQGMMLVERDISADIGISRTPVRAALQQLASEGEMVVYTQGLGMSVRIMTAHDVEEIFFLRTLIDRAAADRFIETASLAEMQALVILKEQICGALEREDYQNAMKMIAQFHQYILDHCDNMRLSRIMNNILPHIRQMRRILMQSEDAKQVCNDMCDFYECYCATIQQRDLKGIHHLLHTYYEKMKQKQIALLCCKETP